MQLLEVEGVPQTLELKTFFSSEARKCQLTVSFLIHQWRDVLGCFKSDVRFNESTLNCNISINIYSI